MWLDFLEALRVGRIARERIATLKRIPMGGAAVSEALIAGFAEFGIEVTHCWGMTEISPLGLVNVAKSGLDPAAAHAARSAQGLPIPCCDLWTVGADGQENPRDGKTPRELQVRSPWAADGYFDDDQPGNRLAASDAFALDRRGRRWLRTGDIATIDRLAEALASALAKWQVPDAFIVLPRLSKGNTGKIDKRALRAGL